MHARLPLIMPVVDFNHSDLLSHPHLFKGKDSKVPERNWGKFSLSMGWPWTSSIQYFPLHLEMGSLNQMKKQPWEMWWQIVLVGEPDLTPNSELKLWPNPKLSGHVKCLLVWFICARSKMLHISFERRGKSFDSKLRRKAVVKSNVKGHEKRIHKLSVINLL